MALPLFAVTLFVSAFLLFLVQPMIGKMILPKLGGTPQVWNTCMVFFQAALLAGYAYTHTASTRLKLRLQLSVHAALLIVPLVLLILHAYFTYDAATGSNPFSIKDWVPPYGSNPIPATLGLLAVVVGIPFFVVATSAPLLQKWFASTGHPSGRDPYFLYGASNLGSLLALLAYPVLVEPNFLLRSQAWLWTGGYLVLLVLVMVCAVLVFLTAPKVRPAAAEHDGPRPEAAPAPPLDTGPKGTAFKKGAPRHTGPARREIGAEAPNLPRFSDDLTGWRRLRWVLLGAIPSSLMLGVTTHITTDLSPIPLFWLVPLTLYLLSFILVFSRWPVVWTGLPHTVMLFAQPIAIGLMILLDMWGTNFERLWEPITFNVLAFFLTAMVCHGELAKDRPSTRHLTEFYLWMSVGGVVGGIFNGLLAPLVFQRVWEFNLAVIAACLIRPTMRDRGWTDDLLGEALGENTAPAAGPKGKGAPKKTTPAAATPSVTYFLDVALPLVVLGLTLALVYLYMETPLRQAGQAHRLRQEGALTAGFTALAIGIGIPLAISCFYLMRPIRFGLALASIILVTAIFSNRGSDKTYYDRSYYGIIRVQVDDTSFPGQVYTTLTHGHINHGKNFQRPAKKDWNKPDLDFSRLATTYYHRQGPAGLVMEQFNWGSTPASPAPVNTYHADARLPASLVGLGAWPGLANLPLQQLVDLWSEPPFATIGLGTGTMASYGRPFQHVHFYEIDNHIRRLSLPQRAGDEKFNYLLEAKARGCEVQVLMGDARLRMAQPYAPFNEEKERLGQAQGGGPDNFYHMMVVDAFSSDAIPVHLLTKEAFQMYFRKLTEKGILCVHTSNRYVELPKVVADVSKELGYACLRGHDNAPGRGSGKSIDEESHYTSEWVMVARKADYLQFLYQMVPADYLEKLHEQLRRERSRSAPEPYWSTPTAEGRHIWTDDYSNLLAVLRR